MSNEITLETTEKKYLGKEATEKLIENIKNKMSEALVDKISYNEQTLTEEQKKQTRKNIGVIQADYAQNDENAVDYIKNRLAYTEDVKVELGNIVFEEQLNLIGYGVINYGYAISNSCSSVFLKENTYYKITINSVSYDTLCKSFINDSYMLGNLNMYCKFAINSGAIIDNIKDIKDTGENFFAANYYENGDNDVEGYYFALLLSPELVSELNTDTITVTIQEYSVYVPEVIHKIDPKYYERLAWEEKELVEVCNLLPTDAVECAPPEYVFLLNTDKKPIIGDIYTFIVNGVEYKLECKSPTEVEPDYVPNGDEDIWVFGNLGIIDPEFGITDEPFIVEWIFNKSENINGLSFVGLFNMETLDIENEYVEIIDLESLVIKYEETVVHKIDTKFYDRLAWTEDNIVEIMPETSVPQSAWIPLDTNDDNNIDIYMIEEPSSNWNVNLVNDDKYTIVFDGVSYNCTVETMLDVIPCMGNLHIFAFAGFDNVIDNGMPFVIYQQDDVFYFVITEQGQHDIAVYKIEEEIHKIDQKFLPDAVTGTNADMAVNNMFSEGFVKNRPIYDGVLEINTREAEEAGACCISNNNYKCVKISEYFEPDLNILNTTMEINGTSFLWSDLGCKIEKGIFLYTWSVVNTDIQLLIGFSADTVLQNQELSDEFNIFKNIEPGVYAVYTEDAHIRIKMPIHKQLDYNNLSNLPFGYVPERIFEFTDTHAGDYNAYVAKLNSSGQIIESISYYLKFSKTFSYEELLGKTVYLSNGTSLKIRTEELNRIPKSDESKNLIFRNLIMFTNVIMSNDIEIPLSEYYIDNIANCPADLGGVYINRNTSDGVYVTGITLEDAYFKKIDAKFLPDSMDSNLITDEEMDALDASII